MAKLLLPLVNVYVWETRWLNTWMELQPAYNWTLVEAEKDALDVIFNHLTELSKKAPQQAQCRRFTAPSFRFTMALPLLFQPRFWQRNRFPRLDLSRPFE